MGLPENGSIAGGKITREGGCQRYDHVYSKSLAFFMCTLDPLYDSL